MPHIIVLGTLDTKLSEILYLRSRLDKTSIPSPSPLKITLIDCGRSSHVSNDAITMSQSHLVSRYGARDGAETLSSMPRGEAINYMITCATACVKQISESESIHGVISAGGSGGTTLAAAVMREAVPIGVPKLIVSTIASGDTGPIVGETDITMMYSVVDIAGTNSLLRNILNNAAGAMTGMATAYEKSLQSEENLGNDTRPEPRIRVGITMFGVTTPCVDKIREHLEQTYPVQVYVFHATGHGGKAMERLVQEGRLDAVLDMTTTEICDLLMGGNMSAGPARLEAALKAGIPNIISFGATDMVNFGPRSTVPEHYKKRKLFEHNPSVTLMRTTKEECQKIGEFIVEKIKRFARDPKMVQVIVPKGGVSMIAVPGEAFADECADQALTTTVKEGLRGSGVRIVEDDRDINDQGFAVDVAEALMRLVEDKRDSA